MRAIGAALGRINYTYSTEKNHGEKRKECIKSTISACQFPFLVEGINFEIELIPTLSAS